PTCPNSSIRKSHWSPPVWRPTCWVSTVTRSPQRRLRPSPPPTHDQISNTGYCERSTTVTNTARTALSGPSTPTYSSISTHRSSATISSISSATTPGPSEMHSDSTYLSSPKRKLPAGDNPEPRPPSASTVRICGLLVTLDTAAMAHA